MTCGQLDIGLHVPVPTLVPILFSPVSHPYFLEITPKIFLMCLFVFFLMAFGHLKWLEFATTTSTLILTSAVLCLVFHFKHTPRSREESWKATVWSTSSVSEPESLRRLGAILSVIKLIYKNEVYIISYRKATQCIHRQLWEEEITGVWQHSIDWNLRRILVAIK